MKFYSLLAVILIIGIVIWSGLTEVYSDPKGLISDYGHFFFIGLLGAIVANSTGSGGGIVFIPFFSALGLTTSQVLSTSILIQCFGMTAGSISWLYSMQDSKRTFKSQDQLIKQLLLLSGVATFTGVLVAQYLLPDPGVSMAVIFRYFSVLFGIALLINALSRQKKHYTRHSLTANDRLAVLITSFAGGMLVKHGDPPALLGRH